MRKLTVIIIVVILAIIVATQVSAIKNIGQKPKLYSEKTRVLKDNIKALISASGKIRSNTVITLKFQTSGLLSYVGVKEGNMVTKGKLIASLDRRELEKTLKKKLNDYMSERWDFEEDKNVTYKDKALNDTIKRTLEKNGFDLGTTVLDVEIADIALKFANLYSPIDGIVTEVDAPRAGVNITAGTATFSVADYNDIAFKIDVDEVDIGRVKIGQLVDIKLDAYEGQKFMGVVDKIGFTSTTTTSGGTAFPVEVHFPDNADLRFKIGMNGDADIVTNVIENTLVVPVDYVFENANGQKYVNILDKSDQIKRATVKIGVETEDQAEILSGVKEGETVIIPITD